MLEISIKKIPVLCTIEEYYIAYANIRSRASSHLLLSAVEVKASKKFKSSTTETASAVANWELEASQNVQGPPCKRYRSTGH